MPKMEITGYLEDGKMKIMIVLVSVCLAVPALGKRKINSEDFKLDAVITEVNSQTQPKTITTTHPNLPSYCRDPKPGFQEGYCRAAAAGGDRSNVESSTYYVLTTEIGDKIYDLQGPRLELGKYHARFTMARRGWPEGVAVLGRDKKGRPAEIWYRIVGERLKNHEPK
jgi:hypothetical protein